MFPKPFKTRGVRAHHAHACCCFFALSHKTTTFCRSTIIVEHGSHNVSRWMTWLSISLKNAAACDKWYQLQNHSITESLNANGAWEKPFVGHPRACRISVSNKQKQKNNTFGIKFLLKTRVRTQARRPSKRRVAVWFGVCCVRRKTMY